MKTILQVSKRGAITLPPSIRRKYGLEGVDTPLVIVEERDGELVLCPATAVPIRDIPADKIKDWIRTDEAEIKAFKQTRKWILSDMVLFGDTDSAIYGMGIRSPGEFLVEQRKEGRL